MNMRKIPVILDADTGIDDTMALLICATSSKLDVLAAVSTFGNTTIDYATQNTMDVLALCGRQDTKRCRCGIMSSGIVWKMIS